MRFGFWTIDAWNAKYSKTHAFRTFTKKYPYHLTICGLRPHPQLSEDLTPSTNGDLSCGRCQKLLEYENKRKASAKK